jgi:hypothetical protein
VGLGLEVLVVAVAEEMTGASNAARPRWPLRSRVFCG